MSKSALVAGLEVVRDTESIFGLKGMDGRPRIIAARPKNIESCRGGESVLYTNRVYNPILTPKHPPRLVDAPHGVVVDEVAFVQAQWFDS